MINKIVISLLKEDIMEKLRIIYKKVCEWIAVLKEKIVSGFKTLTTKAIKAYVDWKVNKHLKDKKK
jgi:hypothetical protein